MARSRTIAGVTLIVAGAALPLLVRLVGTVWIRSRAALDPIPDQGAMVLVYLSSCASIAVGLLLAVAGLILLMRRRHSAAETRT